MHKKSLPGHLETGTTEYEYFVEIVDAETSKALGTEDTR